jgi:hypothetical protein
VSEIQIASDYTPLPRVARGKDGELGLATLIKHLTKIADGIGDDAPVLSLRMSMRDYRILHNAGMKLPAAYAANPNLRKLMKCSVHVDQEYAGDPQIVRPEGHTAFDGVRETQERQDAVKVAEWRSRGF